MAQPRSKSRIALAGLLSAGLPDGTTVLKYRKADPKGVSPMVQVVSGGTARPKATLRGSFPQHDLRIYVLVLHSDPEGSWTEEMAEDKLDQLEDMISEIIDRNQKVEGVWKSISYAEGSIAERVQIGGVPYLLEVIPLQIEVLA